MKIGILATGTNEPPLLEVYGSFADMTETMLLQLRSDLVITVYEVRLGEFPDAVDECDAWVITGSANSTYEPLPWIKSLERLIGVIAELRIPLLGICFGHQIIAQALGGQVAKVEAGWGLGLHHYNVTPAGQMLLGTDSLSLNVIHQDQVVDLPETAEVLAESTFCPNAVLRYGNHILTVQAHPEFRTDYMSALLLAITPAYISEAEAREGLNSLDSEKVAINADRFLIAMAGILLK
ncbi:type 1 glutamine amidotransferase [Amphritea balenae]|uniref:Type 1 glutamine amidotransferase n=1 Tax=Amphritea balenae TaxID=452629 RepID=A0A3P1SVL3_9GAMM|nr:type 1 glutamine amidotransferase [Amphritea balenae]RRD01252.1 type 1 glutamine amidotransferase [Amphritea balenae]GGK58717.1 GMP synthase [Amphritea balenae]